MFKRLFLKAFERPYKNKQIRKTQRKQRFFELSDCPFVLCFLRLRLFKDDIHVQVVYKEERIPFTLKYAGTMADEDALKAANSFKGASGIKMCMDCKGLINTTDDSILPPGTWSLNATSLKDRARNTHADIWRAADSLHQLACDGRAYHERSKELGLTYNPRVILWDVSLRHIHKPIDSYIRDWMHIWVSGGVCNWQICGLKAALKDNGIPISIVGGNTT